MHVLIAPNAFKHGLDARDAAIAIEKGLQQSRLSCTTQLFPVGDGGDGTGKLIIQHCGGSVIPAQVNDPLKRKINASFGLIDHGHTAVIEMADASGLRLLKKDELNPLSTTSYGTGELILQALDHHVNKIILCIGGSATVDGGTGILQALGFSFYDKKGTQLTQLPSGLSALDRISFDNVDSRLQNTELFILCDVENTLLGAEGSAAVFGPQKGASPDDVKHLDALLTRLTDVILRQTGQDIGTLKHGGAAGGVAASLSALLNAKPVNGIDYFLSLTGYEEALQKADLVITGEGSIDIQTLQGKGPYGVAKRAKEKGIDVIGLAGKIPDQVPAELRKYFDPLISINKEITALDIALKNTGINLTLTAREIGDKLAR